MAELTLVPLDDEEGGAPPESELALVPIGPPPPRNVGGGSQLAQQAPEKRAVQRTAETMSDLELALTGDAEMAPFSYLSTKEGGESFARAAKRLPGNIKKTIGGQLSEMYSGGREFRADKAAETAQQMADQLQYWKDNPDEMPLEARIFYPTKNSLNAAIRERRRAVKSELATGEEAAAISREARLGQAEATPADAGIVENAIQQGLSSAAISAPAILVAGPTGGAIALGVGTASQRRSQLIEAGVPEADANRSAVFQGSLEALTEFLPGEALVKKVPGFWKHIAEFLVTEVPGENITSVAQMLDDYNLQLRDDVTLDDVLTSLRDTTLATAVGAGAQVGAAHTVQAMVEAANARATERAGGTPPSQAAPIPEGGPVETAPPALPRVSVAPKTRLRREPTIGELPVPRETRPDLGTIPPVETQPAAAAPAVEEPAQPAEPAEKAPVEKVGTEPAEPQHAAPALAESGKNAEVLEDLTAVTEKKATAEQVARLEAQKFVQRSETNEPRLTEAGRARLAQERPEASKPRQTPEERRAAGEAAIARAEQFQRDLEAARAATNAQPTSAQVQAGNYQKGTLRFGGMTIALENPAGTTRQGYNAQGEPTWSRKMTADYGYVKGTEGKDGDQVDVFLAGAPDTGRVFVVNQVNPETGRFDEHKAILGAHTRQEAERVYRSHYPKDWKGFGSMTELPTAEFRGWLNRGNTKRPLDRRSDLARRRRVAEMTTEQMRSELLTHELTKIPNRRAYEEAAKLPHQVAIDVDSLKWVNDNLGHESGNELLKAVATALSDETRQAYHISGDEFVAQAKTPEEAEAVMKRVSERLAGARLVIEMPNGETREISGLGVSYGIGGSLDEADTKLQAHKTEREAAGVRSRRGEAPPGARRGPAREGRPDQESRAAPEEVKLPKFARRKIETLFRGEGTHNRGGAFYSTDREFARQFTQRGLDREVQTIRLRSDEIYEPPIEVYAGDENAVDRAVAEARAAGKRAVRLSEGRGQPKSVILLSRWKFARAKPLTQEQARTFADGIKNSLGLEEFDLRVLPSGDVRLELIIVPKGGRGLGTGSTAMVQLTRWADENRVRLTLTPAGKEKRSDWGTTSKARLERFYRQFGFVMNRSDFGTRDTMIREPQPQRDPRFARFYSSVIRVTEELQQQSASGLQWWNTIKARPGVRQEELDWMGLKDWLGDRKNISKRELLEYLYANQLEITEDILRPREEDGDLDTAASHDLTRAAEWLRARGYDVVFDEDGRLERLQYRSTQIEYHVNPRSGQYGLVDLPTGLERNRAFMIDRLAKQGAKEAPQAEPAQYEEYTLPGGDEYRELLIRLPELPGAAAAQAEADAATQARNEVEVEIERAHHALADKIQASSQANRPLISNLWHWSSDAVGPATELDFLKNDARAKLDKVALSFDAHDEVDKLLEAQKKALEISKRQEAARAAVKGTTYRSQHFRAANIAAHVRLTTRRSSDGVRTLFVEEVQSDWHQRGREHGYFSPSATEYRDKLETIDAQLLELNNERERLATDRLESNQMRDEKRWHELSAQVEELTRQKANLGRAVPDAPFKTTWPELAMKRVIRWAAEHGYDRVAWTTGQQQVERYHLASTVESVKWYVPDSGGKTVVLRLAQGGTMSFDLNERGEIIASDGAGETVGQSLAAVIGTDLAQRALSKDEGYIGESELRGIEVGGEGQRTFYDKILPNTVNKLIKKWGAKVGTATVSTSNIILGYEAYPVPGRSDDVWQIRAVRSDGRQDDYYREPMSQERALAQIKLISKEIQAEVHAFEVTPQMRASVMEGQPLFRRVAPGRGMARPDVQRVVQETLSFARFSQAPAIDVVQTYRELPKDLRMQLEQENATDTTGAVFLQEPAGDRVVIIAENNASEEEVTENVYHELVGHYGLGLIMDQQQYNEIMDGIARDMPERVRESARRNSLDLKVEVQRRAAAEEVIAYAAGRILTGKPIEEMHRSWWKKIVAAVRAFFHSLGDRRTYTEETIAKIVEASKNALQGQQAGVHKSLSLGALRHQRAPLYYSQLFEAINDSKVPNVAPPGEYAKIIASKSGKDVKQEEVEFSGAVEYLQTMTLGKLLWERSGDMTGFPIPDELRAKIERFNTLLTWQKQNKDVMTYRADLKDQEDAIESARAIGFEAPQDRIAREQGKEQPSLGHVNYRSLVSMRSSSVWNQIQQETTALREDPALAVPPKRISKSVVLDFLNKQGVTVAVIPSNEEAASVDWIDFTGRSTEFETVDPDENWLKQNAEDQLDEKDVRERAIEYIRWNSQTYLNEADQEAVENGAEISQEMIGRALEHSSALTVARKHVLDKLIDQERNNYYEYPLFRAIQTDGPYRATVEGSDDSGWVGHFEGPNLDDDYTTEYLNNSRQVEIALRTHAIKVMPMIVSTQFSEYTLPGGKDYGELLFQWTNPKPDMSFDGSHWSQDNVLLHVRYDTREGPNEEKILFVDEIQSDWHQKVRDAQNRGGTVAQRLSEKVAGYQYQYRALWNNENVAAPRVRPSTRQRVQQWLRELPITDEHFRSVVLAARAYMVDRGRNDNTFPAVYDWLAKKTGTTAEILRNPTRAGLTVKDGVTDLNPGLWSWREFIDVYLDHEDAVFNTHVMDMRPNEIEAARYFAGVIGAYSRMGAAFDGTGSGGMPPSARFAQDMMGYMGQTIPTHFEPEDEEATSDTIRSYNERTIQRYSDRFTPEMAGDDTGRKALARAREIEKAFVQFTNGLAEGEARGEPPIDAARAEYARFQQTTGITYSAASEVLDQALHSFMRTAKIPRITQEFEATIRNLSLELTEAASEAYSANEELNGSVGAERLSNAPPLAKTWPLAALKWAIRHAAENGFDQIALAPGSVHGSRWGATAHYDRMNVYPTTAEDAQAGRARDDFFDPYLNAQPNAEDVIRVRLFKGVAESMVDVWTTKARLAGWVGADAARVVYEQNEQRGMAGARSIASVAHGVAIWGPRFDKRFQEHPEAMTRARDIHHGSMEIYNAILPFMFNKFLSKYGAKIRPGKMQISTTGTPESAKTKGLTVSEIRPALPWVVERAEGLIFVHDAAGNPIVTYFDRGQTDEQTLQDAESHRTAAAQHGMLIVDVPVIDLNPKLKDTALNRGFPLFARRWALGARRLGQAVNQGNNTFDMPLPDLKSRFWNYLVYKAQDKFIDLFRTQKAVADWRNAVAIPDALDAYMRQELFHGRLEHRISEYTKQYVDPLVEMIKQSGYTWEEVEEYLYARHAPEANARIRAINPNAPQFSSGMTDQDAAAIMRGFQATPNFGRLLAIGTHVDTMTKFSRDTMVMEGLEDPAMIQAWEQTYQHYVPLKGWAGTDIDTDMPKRGRGFDVGGKLTKMRTGRTTRAATILANVVAQAQSTLILAEKAKVGRALYDFVSSTPAPKLWAVDQVEYMRYVDPSSGLVRQGVNPNFKLADNIIRVRMNGKDYHISFNSENEQMVRLAAAMKNLNADQIGPILSLLHGVNRVLSSLSTSFNPEFTITNALRDLTTAMANLTEQQIPGVRTAIVRDWRKAWWGIRQGEGAPLARGHGQWARYWEEFKAAGGKVGWIDHYKSPQDLERKLRRELRSDNVMTYTIKGITALKDFIENENLAVENAIRLSTFVNLRAAGITEDRAAQAAKNLTVNFNKKGEIGTVMNSLYLFYNASVQGTARLWQLAKSPKGRIVIGGFVVAGIVMDILMRAIGGTDDDDENLYDKVPEHDKERNIIVMIPPHLRGQMRSGEKPYIKLMLPYGFNTFYYSGTVLGKYFDYGFLGNIREVNPGEDAGHVASAFLGAFSPIGDAEGGLSQFLLPTLADPFVQLADNKSWWGGKIMPEDFDEEAPRPDSQRYFQSVPAAYKDFAAYLNAQTGGTEISPGFVDVSPETFQHWVDFSTGGAGRFAVGVLNAPYKAIFEPEELTQTEIPFWRKVVGGIGDRQTQETFFAHINELKYVKRELDAVYKMGITTPEGQERMAYVAKRYPVAVKMVRSAYPNFAEGRSVEDLDKNKILREVQRQAIQPGRPVSAEARARIGQRKAITTTLTDARKELKRLELRKDMPAQERAIRIEQQKKLIHDTLIEFNKQWNAVEDSTYGETRQGKVIEKIGPLISGLPRRQQVRALRAAGYDETASLLFSLPSMPDRFAKEFFAAEAAREENVT